jgi:hypothetical protein
MTESLLFADARIYALETVADARKRERLLRRARPRWLLVTSRHMSFTAPSKRFPDGFEIELHAVRKTLRDPPASRSRSTATAKASGVGDSTPPEKIAVAVIGIERSSWPESALYHAQAPVWSGRSVP